VNIAPVVTWITFCENYTGMLHKSSKEGSHMHDKLEKVSIPQIWLKPTDIWFSFWCKSSSEFMFIFILLKVSAASNISASVFEDLRLRFRFSFGA